MTDVNDAYDDEQSMKPTLLDRERLATMPVDGRVEAENRMWVVCRYPPKDGNWKWCEYSLLVNHPQLPGRGAPYELKNLKSLLAFMEQLDRERVKGREG